MSFDRISKQRNQTGIIAQGARTLRDLVAVLRSAYCGSIGLEYSHVQDVNQVNWMRDRFEVEQPPWTLFTKQQRLTILERLAFR